jgi:endonuclease/exonuclease/phosphatase family metal-dependent hydrolase
MSFNILTSAKKTAEKYGNITLTRAQRMEAAVNMILDLQPDVIGMMEVSDEQKESMESNQALADYALVGSPAETSLHEQGQYIMYNKTKFDLKEWGVKYLSETPDVAHSYVEEALIDNANGADVHQPRKAVYAVLVDKENGQEFAYVATHLDHTPDGSTAEASNAIRKKQAQILVDLIVGGYMFDPSLPFVICGDMNSQPNLDPYNEYLRVTEDARFASVMQPDSSEGTLHSYASVVGTASYIDYVFVSEDDFFCSELDIITEEYYSNSLNMNILPSDHYAVMSYVTLLP